ncbi:MAG TPA: OmpH family outer membrane protein [Pyrinomonadaceae bacterium]
MKIFRTIFAATLMTAAAALAVNAQPAATRPAATPPAAPAASAQLGEAKIALIDTGAFADEKQGIARMIAAVKRVETQFQTVRTELQGMRANLERLTKEINDTKGVADQAALARKAEQAETLEKEIKRKGEDAQGNYQKAMRDALQPVQQDILKALETYAKGRGITVIIDAAQVPILYATPNMDITAAFIADYNQRNPATTAAAAPAGTNR